MHSKKILLLICLLFFGCEPEVEEYLYNKYDSDYAKVVAAAQARCKTDSEALKAIEKTVDPAKYTNLINKIYKISFTGTGELASGGNQFIKIDNIDATGIDLIYYNTITGDSFSGISTKDKRFSITKAQMEDIYSNITNGVCTNDSNDKKYYSSSTLNRDDYLTYTHTRDDGDNDTYKKKTGTYTVDEDLPIIFYIWNSTISQVSKAGSGSEQKTDFSIKAGEVTDFTSSCSSDNECKNIDSVITNCALTVNSGSFSSQDAETEIISFTGC